MNIVYLYLHQIMLKYADTSQIIHRKQAEFIISRYFKFMPKFVRSGVIREMIQFKLLKKLNNHSNYKMKIINIDKSKFVDKGVLLKIIEAGTKKPLL